MEVNTTTVSAEKLYDNLSQLEQGDVVTSAVYRELAQDMLADPEINQNLRQAIADKLNEANRSLGIQSAGKNDSY